MTRKTSGPKVAIRYSEAFKMQLVRELEKGEISYSACQRKYGVKGNGALQRWARKYGNGSLGKVIRVEVPEEIDEKEALKRRVRALEKALADANIDLALERQFVRLACERAGIKDMEGFKKKLDG